LPWEAYCFDAFWYDDTTEMTSLMWQDENFPFHVFRFSESGYNITYSWSSQGYKIKSLHRERSRVVFRKAEKIHPALFYQKQWLNSNYRMRSYINLIKWCVSLWRTMDF